SFHLSSVSQACCNVSVLSLFISLFLLSPCYISICYITVWGFIFLISLSAVCYTTKSLSQFSPLFWKGSSHKPMSNFLMRSFLHIQDMLRGYVLAFPA